MAREEYKRLEKKDKKADGSRTHINEVKQRRRRWFGLARRTDSKIPKESWQVEYCRKH